MTPRLIIDPVLLVGLPGKRLRDCPWLRPNARVIHGNGIFELARALSCPSLDQVQVLARALIVGLRTEVCHVDDQAIAVPVAARVAIPLTDAGRQMRPAVHDDVALPALALADVVEDRNAAGGLHDAAETAAPGGAE